MKFIDTIQNIWKIEELRDKILYTLALILIYRIGSFVILPGIDPTSASLTGVSNEGFAGLINVFAGGAFNRASVFALGIMPYISASIAIQLLTVAVPYFQKLQKEGESGRRQINQITRYLTVVVTLLQGSGYLFYLQNQLGVSPVGFMGENLFFFRLSTMVILSAGTLFAMWIGERITDNGIGNGISILITVGIIASLPGAIIKEFFSRMNESGGLMVFLLEVALLFGIIMAVVALVQATRRVPIQYARRNIVKGGRMMQAGGNRQYLPLKVNASGVMPIIFAQALMFLPGTLAQLFRLDQNQSVLVNLSQSGPLVVQPPDLLPGGGLHLFLHGIDRESGADRRPAEERRWLHPGCQTGASNRRIYRQRGLADHPSGVGLPGAGGHPAGLRHDRRGGHGVRLLLRRDLVADHRCSDARHAAADRKLSSDEAL